MWIVALFPIFAEANRCLGLTIEGGGAKGAYSAAVMKAFTENLPAEDLEYDIIVGVSAGGLNTGAYSQFPKG